MIKNHLVRVPKIEKKCPTERRKIIGQLNGNYPESAYLKVFNENCICLLTKDISPYSFWYTSSINVALASENATMFWCSASGEVTDIAHAISTYASCAVSNWMNSTSGHKENMLSSGHTSIGVGVFYSGGCLYCIQLFGHETKICSNHTWVSMDTVTYEDLDGNILIKNACYYCSVCGSLKNDDGYVTSGKYYFTSQ